MWKGYRKVTCTRCHGNVWLVDRAKYIVGKLAVVVMFLKKGIIVPSIFVHNVRSERHHVVTKHLEIYQAPFAKAVEDVGVSFELLA